MFDGKVIDQVVMERYAAYHGDCIEVLRGLPDNSVGYSIFSPPFSSLYTYSSSPRDMGNVRNDEEFFAHFDFLVSELLRVLKPGRNISFHCMDMPASKERDGYWIKGFPRRTNPSIPKAWIYFPCKGYNLERSSYGNDTDKSIRIAA